jgi:hypothetical protein
MFPGVTPSHRSAPSAARWLVGIVLIAGRLLACVLGPRPVSATERHIAGELVGALTKAIRVAGGR